MPIFGQSSIPRHNTITLPISIDLPFVDILYKWNHKICDLLLLDFFSLSIIFLKFCRMYKWFILLTDDILYALYG